MAEFRSIYRRIQIHGRNQIYRRIQDRLSQVLPLFYGRIQNYRRIQIYGRIEYLSID